MNALTAALSPPLLAVFAVLSLGFGTLLFFLTRRSDVGVIENDAPLSWAEPIEVRLVLYLILAAVCATAALAIRLIVGFTSVGAVARWALLVLIVLGFISSLGFLYAAGGSLLQGALGMRGRPAFWLWRLLSPVDGFIMDLGDVLARMLFHPAPPRQRRPGRRASDYYDEYDDDYDRPARTRSARSRRVRYVGDDECGFDSQPSGRREPVPYPDEQDRVAPRRREPAAYRDEPERILPRRREPVPYPDEQDHVEPRRREPAAYTDEPERISPRRREAAYMDEADYAPPRRREGALSAEAAERPPRRPARDETLEAEYVEDYEVAEDTAGQRSGGRKTRRTKEDILRERLEMAIREYESALTPAQREKLREMRGIIESIRVLR